MSQLFLITVLLYFSIFFKLETFGSNLSDFSFRTSSNETPFNSYSFFWTNFWYVPIFFLMLNLTKITVKKISYTLFCIFIFYFYEFFDLSSGSWISTSLSRLKQVQNVLLSNSLNKYHPGIFYISVSFFLYMFLNTIYSSFNLNSLWKNEKISNTTSYFFIKTLNWSLVALYLGSWWALQEGTWGGWWNWDASEVFGFFLHIFALRLIHEKSPVKNFLTLRKTVFFYFNFFILLYILLQLNFDLISHNFGIKFFFFFNSNWFFFEVFLVIFIIIDVLVQRFNFNFYLALRYKHRPFIYARVSPSFWIYFLFVSWILLASFSSIISYFLWSYFSITLLNTFGSHSLLKFKSFCFVISWFFLAQSPYALIYTYLICCCLTNINFFTFTLKFNRPLILQLHTLLFFFVLFNILASDTTLFYSFNKSFRLISPLVSNFWLCLSSFYLEGVVYCESLVISSLWSLQPTRFTFFSPIVSLSLFNFFVSGQIFYSMLFSMFECFNFVSFIESFYLVALAITFFIASFTATQILLQKKIALRF